MISSEKKMAELGTQIDNEVSTAVGPQILNELIPDDENQEEEFKDKPIETRPVE